MCCGHSFDRVLGGVQALDGFWRSEVSIVGYLGLRGCGKKVVIYNRHCCVRRNKSHCLKDSFRLFMSRIRHGND